MDVYMRCRRSSHSCWKLNLLSILVWLRAATSTAAGYRLPDGKHKEVFWKRFSITYQYSSCSMAFLCDSASVFWLNPEKSVVVMERVYSTHFSSILGVRATFWCPTSTTTVCVCALHTLVDIQLCMFIFHSISATLQQHAVLEARNFYWKFNQWNWKEFIWEKKSHSMKILNRSRNIIENIKSRDWEEFSVFVF